MIEFRIRRQRSFFVCDFFFNFIFQAQNRPIEWVNLTFNPFNLMSCSQISAIFHFYFRIKNDIDCTSYKVQQLNQQWTYMKMCLCKRAKSEVQRLDNIKTHNSLRNLQLHLINFPLKSNFHRSQQLNKMFLYCIKYKLFITNRKQFYLCDAINMRKSKH